MSLTITHKAVRIIATAFCTASASTDAPATPEYPTANYIVIENYNTKDSSRRTHNFLDPVFIARKAAPTNTL